VDYLNTAGQKTTEVKNTSKCLPFFSQNNDYNRLLAKINDVDKIAKWNQWMGDFTFSERLCPTTYNIYQNATKGQVPKPDSFDTASLYAVYKDLVKKGSK
jgi:hypothetical protein